jgi:hypothetical protein
MTVFEVLDEYVYSKRGEIDNGNDVVVEVRDTDTFERLVVRAKIAPPGRSMPGGNPLVLRNLAENVAEDGWTIQIIEELDPESVEIKPQSAYRKDAGPNV